jgi:hypothetical protein
MTLQQQDALIKELIDLTLELGANKFYINKLILTNGMTLQEAICRGYINDNESVGK